MTLEQIHILKVHKKLHSDYFGNREIDIYLCNLMAFNDAHSKKDGSNFNKYTKMYNFTPGGIVLWEEINAIPLVFYDEEVTSEDDICKVCRYKFFEMKGLIMDSTMWDRMRGVEFMKSVDKNEDNGKN